MYIKIDLTQRLVSSIAFPEAEASTKEEKYTWNWYLIKAVLFIEDDIHVIYKKTKQQTTKSEMEMIWYSGKRLKRRIEK